jgi:predicted anti-sigma-YlaC factor YlaD
MTCKEFVDFLMSYLDHELESAQNGVFEGHLDACPPCRDYLKTYEETIRLGKLACGEQDGGVPEDAPERLIQAILAARNAS